MAWPSNDNANYSSSPHSKSDDSACLRNLLASTLNRTHKDKWVRHDAQLLPEKTTPPTGKKKGANMMVTSSLTS